MLLTLSEVDHLPLGLVDVQLKAVLLAPQCQFLHLLCVSSLVIVGDEAQQDSVVCELDDRVVDVCGQAVMW